MEGLDRQWEFSARALASRMASWWEADVVQTKEDTPEASNEDILHLPHPYITAGGSTGSFPHMYGWDTNFINLALLEQGYEELVRGHLLNQLYMIETYGYVLNANALALASRSQTPMLHESVRQYLEKVDDKDLANRLYPALKREFYSYWLNEPHRRGAGWYTYYDQTDQSLPLQLASEAESGLDFTPLYGGDVTLCRPVILYSALARFAENMRYLAASLDLPHEERIQWEHQREALRTALDTYCYDASTGWYHTYHEKKGRLPVMDLTGCWPLYAGIASERQAKRVSENLERFLQPGGLSQTDRIYDSPHPHFPSWLQWQYPAGWAPMQLIACIGLLRYGYIDPARRIARRWAAMILEVYERTGNIYEKYNVMEANELLPLERYGNLPMHGWSCASFILFEQFLYSEETASLIAL